MNKIFILDIYFKFFFYFNKKQKINTICLFVLGLFSSFLEFLSIGLIVPFVILITEPEKIYELSLHKIIVGEKIFLLNELIFIIFFLFIGIILVVAFLKIIHLKLNCYISYDLIRTFGHILFKRVLNQDFKIFESMNTKDVVTTILLRSQNVGEANFFMTTLFTSLTIVFFLLINIIYFAPLKIIIFLSIIFSFYVVFWKLIKKKIVNYSKIYSDNFQKLNKNIIEMMSSYTDIILYKLHNFFLDDFKKNNDLLRTGQGQITFLTSYPNIIIQAIVIIILIVLIFFFYSSETLKDQLPFLILLVFSAQRIMPNLQTIFTSYTNLTYFKENLNKVFILLNLKTSIKEKIGKISEDKTPQEKFDIINLKNIKFSYFNRKNTLFDNLNLKIKQGEKVALIGESGSGKTTLIKIILGLIKPLKGYLFFNEKKLDEQRLDWWQSQVAYIPQKIFMLDASLYENISLKKYISKKEEKQINVLLKMLNLLNLFSCSRSELKNLGGEDGKKFSGGEIQRIAIARAIMQNKKFIILDETLNALDKKNIINIINMLNKMPLITVLIITHSNFIFKKCDKVLKIKNKKIYEVKFS
jgi:ATP-binding cassette subfamily B protein